ncbi:MAG: hypothetical protein COX29_04150 [Candidatus Moranbacteria bacterium CG23_combo_of_CG06-09_8_20_14_all_35_22]|nr:MAG: hypothetical protein COX29_04150 [Candidatus Moranbacteria bacterium CG23_combo_of_CG06-09_8_20_14_all_35_22]
MPNELEQPNLTIIRRRKKENGDTKDTRLENGQIIKTDLIGGITPEEVNEKEVRTKNEAMERKLKEEITDFLATRK